MLGFRVCRVARGLTGYKGFRGLGLAGVRGVGFSTSITAEVPDAKLYSLVSEAKTLSPKRQARNLYVGFV